MKKCYRCGNILPFDNFHISNRSKDGYRPDCKECRKNDNNKNKKNMSLNIEKITRVI